MLIHSHPYGYQPPQATEITPEHLFRQRRTLLQFGGGLGLLGLAPGVSSAADSQAPGSGKLQALVRQTSGVDGAQTMEKWTPYKDVTGYNNFYEFGTDKSEPAQYAHGLKTKPWEIAVEGLVRRPGKLGLDELLRLAPLEERVYRLRCVEGWSMVIPWVGYSLSALLKQFEPLGSAKFVEFTSAVDPNSMRGVRSNVLDWPYTEGLRLDEALHPLTLLALGLYGEVLPNQNGAPVRLVVPWKYGFKSAKSIVRIRLTDRMPTTAWNKAAPGEYGFYSNVNPNVDHPRWSQGTERRLGEDGLFSRKRKTLMFNGYEAQVGQLYAGMDLRRYF
ncbi:protein-methionine-sulfoxide reductase catalytic subunit MsrP [Curvibacter sp. APW13]|uniref:protein-methionine-sulfoxide reductase catalytic subunit MsrP n=1 Tax=Curvibacter sp. APW13 TaxID=3077236 RepID=UPI0028DFCA97|nr:protein-methionine-sulfoxide reductase catalytic subunit MsrP [Curvibacter sp. APW13]MDT8989595.1 protein-methionine-sulfoxide reductase catalytic subunit MsrP [Curvibacter sp. APW13]